MKHIFHSICALIICVSMLASLCVTASAKQPSGLFEIKLETVTKISVQNGSTGKCYTLRNSLEWEMIVSQLNEFRYTETKLVDMGGWTYRITIQSEENTVDFTFSQSVVSMDGVWYVSDGQPLSEITALLDDVFSERQSDFRDVSFHEWYFDPVMACADAGIINGMGDGIFAPNESVTRAQAAKMIVLASGVAYDETATADFSDTSGHWAESYIAAAAENDLMTGMGDGTFQPEGTLTRAQLASLIVKAMGLTSTDGTLTFADVGESAWYYGDVAKASAAGYVQGDENGYRPEDSVKRSEFAKVICQMYLSE